MTLAANFEDTFGHPPAAIAAVPGRVNLIGEHTDYNGGAVLPAAIERRVQIALRPNDGNVIAIKSTRFDDRVKRPVGDPKRQSWTDYAVGALWKAEALGWHTGGTDLFIDSDVPDGAGVSSSAALITAILRAAADLAMVSVDPVAIAQHARAVENDYIGMPCGIMDQMAVAVAKPGEALFLDTGSLDYDSIPLPEDVSFMVIHSGVHRELADGRYKQRADECLEAKSYFGKDYLCQLTLDQVEGAVDLAENVKRRVRHCITEHERTVQAASHLRARDFVRFGESMNASHVSMRDDFEMSVPAIDRLVESAVEAGALGARLTGGGFGGCIVAAVPVDASEVWLGKVLAQHPDAFLVE